MIVQDWMSKKIATVRPEDTASAARRLISKHRVRQLPVLQNGKLVGIVTDRDLRAAPDDASLVEQLMTFQPKTVAPDDFVDTAAYLLRTRKINAAPVVSGDRVLGIITTSDLLDAFVTFSGVTKPSYSLTILPRKGSHAESLRDILEARGAEVRWMQARQGARPREVHARIKSTNIDTVTEALEAAGHTISCVLMTPQTRRHK